MYKPLDAITHKSPTVFKATVFPPVLGPVIIRQEKSIPNLMLIGTTTLAGINGWRAFCKDIIFLLSKIGSVASILTAYFAFANEKSIFPIILTFLFNSDIKP